MTVYVKQNSLIVNTYFLLVLRFVFQEHGDFTWRVSDCEELVGVTHRRLWGWFFGGYSVKMTLLRLFDVPEVLEVQEVPSDDVRIVPDLPPITKVLFP